MSDAPEPDDDPEVSRYTVVFLAVAVEGGLAALAVALGFLFDQAPLARLPSDGPALGAGLGWGLVAAAPLVAAFLTMDRWPVGPLRRVKAFTESTVVPLMRPCTRVDLFGISCLAGLGEEMFFRGWAQDFLAGAVPTGYAVAGAALAFGLLHAVTPTYAVLAALIGAYLGWLYVATDNLLAPVVAHAAYDFVALWVVVRGPWRPDAPGQ